MYKKNKAVKSLKQIAAAYEKGYGPYRQMYKQLQLPGRFPKGDFRNDER